MTTTATQSNHYRRQHDERALSDFFGRAPKGRSANERQRRCVKPRAPATTTRSGDGRISVDSTTNGVRLEINSDTVDRRRLATVDIGRFVAVLVTTDIGNTTSGCRTAVV